MDESYEGKLSKTDKGDLLETFLLVSSYGGTVVFPKTSQTDVKLMQIIF